MADRPSRRVHFKDGTIQDVHAETADEARKCARPGEIDKVKLNREKVHG